MPAENRKRVASPKEGAMWRWKAGHESQGARVPAAYSCAGMGLSRRSGEPEALEG